MPDTLHLLGRAWPLRVRRHPRARRATLRVSPAGSVTLTLPPATPPQAAAACLRRARPWLEARLATLAAEAVVPEHIHLQAVDVHRRVCRVAGWEGLEDEGERLRVGGTDAEVLARLRDWLKAQGRHWLPIRLTQVSQDCGLGYRRLVVRHQRSRWGSCSARGEISLNCAALLLPPEALRCLLVHELCHTLEANHSPRFWAEVAARQPDYRRWERFLDRAMGELPFWARPQ